MIVCSVGLVEVRQVTWVGPPLGVLGLESSCTLVVYLAKHRFELHLTLDFVLDGLTRKLGL
jgi:hypothetical protein